MYVCGNYLYLVEIIQNIIIKIHDHNRQIKKKYNSKNIEKKKALKI